ncbi:hypothetical protein [Acaryochloris sp. IP29b_bin.148]|uniref:hypothetical protein n=1 Tax=Acaryochloris sp. IP29b_bin.148 TaxID=2969218 RepID=UPI002625F864|nr:hypothetical protein [Acaryochloris sp. IP29b_bin.148]
MAKSSVMLAAAMIISATVIPPAQAVIRSQTSTPQSAEDQATLVADRKRWGKRYCWRRYGRIYCREPYDERDYRRQRRQERRWRDRYWRQRRRRQDDYYWRRRRDRWGRQDRFPHRIDRWFDRKNHGGDDDD